jgi:hypothetical protein
MKHTKRTYNKNKTHYKKRRSNKKTKKVFFNKDRKTRKQSGSGKYKPNDIYDIDQFITNDCLNVLKRELTPSEKGMLTKMFTSKKNDPYVKCRRSIAVLNTEKMPPDEYLKYRRIIRSTKLDPNLSNPQRGDIEDIGKNYIFDYVFSLHGKRSGGGTTALQNLLQVISPCYLIKLLTLGDYDDYIDRLGEKSKMKKEQGKYASSITAGLKRRVDTESIYQWVKGTNFELFKLKTPQDLVNLFNSYYPINCPYHQELNHFHRISIKVAQLPETNSRYINNSSWDLYFKITLDQFYNDYFLATEYDFEKVLSDLYGESFARDLSTNIIDSNGNIVFKSSDCYEDGKNQNFEEIDKYFNNFILKLNELGGTGKIDNNPANIFNGTTFNYNNVRTNEFIENIVKFLAISMYPLMTNVTVTTFSPNYYGLFYHYYEEGDFNTRENFADNSHFLYSSQVKGIPITKFETEIIENYINSKIPNYAKCVEDLRKYEPDNLFPSCRIIDMQKKMLLCMQYYIIKVPTVTTTPQCTVGRYIQIMQFNNINGTYIRNDDVTIYGIIIWGGQMSSIVGADEILPTFVGNTFYQGLLKPIISSLKPDATIESEIPVNSIDTTPRNTMAQMDMPTFGVTRGSNDSIGSTVTLG